MADTSIKITVDVGSMQKLVPFAQQLKPKALAALQAAFKKALPVVIENERVKTGNLRRSTGISGGGTSVELRASAPYAGYQDQGTRYFEGTHFMEAGMSVISAEIPTALKSIMII